MTPVLDGKHKERTLQGGDGVAERVQGGGSVCQ